jgi:hypothetical protein
MIVTYHVAYSFKPEGKAGCSLTSESLGGLENAKQYADLLAPVVKLPVCVLVRHDGITVDRPYWAGYEFAQEEVSASLRGERKGVDWV